MPSAAADPKGLKRICPSCGNRYYDLNKRPVTCPSCATEFTGEQKVKARRGRAAIVEEDDTNGPATAAKKGAAANDEDEVEGDADTVSLDEVEALEEGDDTDEDAIEIEDLDDVDDDLIDDEEVEDDVEEEKE